MGRQIVIIGAGVIGVSTAYYSLKKGHNVTLIERASENAEGCSYGNAGMIVPSHFVPLAAPGMVALGLKWMWDPESPFYVKPRFDAELLAWGLRFWRAATPERVNRAAPVLRDLHLASRDCFAQLAQVSGNDFGLVTKGLLMLCQTRHALDEESKAAEQALRLGVPAEVLDARRTAALDPNARMEIAGSVYFPKDCHLSPGRFMAGMKLQVKQLGGKFVYQTEATGWRQSGQRIEALRTQDGELHADEFVLCGGSWSSSLARELGLRIPMQAGKGYSLTLPHPRQLPEICTILTEARVAVTPMGKALRVGGTMEISGLNEEINPRRVQGIIKSFVRYYPDFKQEDFANIHPWSGLRPCSPDGLPYVGRTRRFSNLSIATGHSMMGLSLGPITGKLMAEILSHERSSIEISLLHPDRYG